MKIIAAGLLLSICALVSYGDNSEIAAPVSNGVETYKVETRIRIYRIVIFSENGASGVAILREKQRVDSKGAILDHQALPVLKRALKSSESESIKDSDGKTVTFEQVLGEINQFAQKWAAEDSANIGSLVPSKE